MWRALMSKKILLKHLKCIGSSWAKITRKTKSLIFPTTRKKCRKKKKIKDDFKEKLLAAIAKMTPKKFEAFSRALLNKRFLIY